MVVGAGVAQTPINRCATDEMQEYYIKTVPGYKQKLEEAKAQTAREFEAYKLVLAQNNVAGRAATLPTNYTFTVPVVFHILHTNGPENVSDAVCISALDQVNKDYARASPDVNLIDPLYEPLYVNSYMKFVFAKKDPAGNCTNGIVHHYNVNTKWTRNIAHFIYSTVGTYNWSPSRYMNVYIVDDIASSGVGQTIGYTNLPGTAASVGSDAIVYNRNFLSGTNGGCNGLWVRSLSHEIGHWFGLSHTFGSTNSAGVMCGNDDIADTPPTAGFFSNCPPYITLNDSCSPGHRPNINNIMDYSGLPLMFTQGQTDKIRFTAQNSTANRNYLVDTTNLVFTGILTKSVVSINALTGDTVFSYAPAPTVPCAPIADFYANKAKSCQGQAVIYNSTSYNSSTGLTYSWAFEGGSPATSTLSAPSVTYSTPGIYSTTLTVTNAAGSSTKVRMPFPSVSWHADRTNFPAIEGFETPAANYLPNGWTATNADYGTITWQSGNYGSGSSKCVMLANANEGSTMFTGGNTDILETSSYNFSNTSNIGVSFDYSYARKAGVSGDQFKVEYSLDCGGNWLTLNGTPSTTVMATNSGGMVNAPYIPYDQSKWKTFNYPVAAVTALNNKADVKFRFTFINNPSGQAQNFYFDNFNIAGTVGLEELASTIGLNIYPNPTLSSATLEFTSPVDAKASVSVYDVTGRLVEQSAFATAAGNMTKYEVNKQESLKAGIYFITLDLNDQKVTRKLVIE
eukprot:TRINITY_DN1251_c0_g1_i1.p1 TRINITY_DN1251_c0_g1~~TRINITY_DN1251_c0_g1_i1.p1  ORF type:complete len:755 (+),score=52.97 TRINITY_DN1251_c0_g1_i1:54-2267(+)